MRHIRSRRGGGPRRQGAQPGPSHSTLSSTRASSRDGTESFFVRGDTMVAARVEADLTFRVLSQQPLFEIPLEILSVGSAVWVDGQNLYDVAPDGRFLMGR